MSSPVPGVRMALSARLRRQSSHTIGLTMLSNRTDKPDMWSSTYRVASRSTVRRAGVLGVADGRGLGDETFELGGLSAGRVFGAALDEDPLTQTGSVASTW
jgi:hypothetical protein